MNTRNKIIILVLVILGVIVPMQPLTEKHVKHAKEFIALFNNKDFHKAFLELDPTMKQAMPEEKISTVWQNIIDSFGTFQKVVKDTVSKMQNYYVVLLSCQFEKNLIDIKLAIDHNEEIAGFFFIPHEKQNTNESDSKKTYPYKSEDVTFENKNAKITLAGTLTLPDSGEPFPTVLLIPGSGPQDRDETVYDHKIFLVLADYLTRHGIAVLRVDDRGIGKSTGSFESATTLELASDALAGVDYLTTRKDIDQEKIGLIGHSEGGLIAPIVANKSSVISFIVLLAPPALPGKNILLAQTKLIGKAEGLSDSLIKVNSILQQRLFKIVKSEKDTSSIKIKLKKILEKTFITKSVVTDEQKSNAESVIKKQIDELTSPWLKFFLAYNPVLALHKLRCPVLAIWGDKDLQVPPSMNASILEEAVRSGGNRQINIVVLPGLNHLFQKANTGSPSEYAIIKETMDTKALDTITNWLLKEVGK